MATTNNYEDICQPPPGGFWCVSSIVLFVFGAVIYTMWRDW